MSGGRYGVVPSAAIFDPALSPVDLRVLAALATYADGDGRCRPSQVRMAERLGMARSTVLRSIQRLVATGHLRSSVRRAKTGGRLPNAYQIVHDRPQGELDFGGHEPAVQGCDDATSEPGSPPRPCSGGATPPLSHTNAHPCSGGATRTLPKNITNAAAAASAQAREPHRLVDVAVYRSALAEALGPVADRPTVVEELGGMDVPLEWVRQGADPYRDVVPTVQRIVGRGVRPRTLGYFTEPVMEARAKRADAVSAVAPAHASAVSQRSRASGSPRQTSSHQRASLMAALCAGLDDGPTIEGEAIR